MKHKRTGNIMAGALGMTRFFQLGFVVNDIERGMQTMRDRYSIPSFHSRRHSDDLMTANAYVNGIMVELIQCTPGSWAVYDGFYPQSVRGAKLHHHGYLFTDASEWQDVDKAAADTGLTRFDAQAFDGDLRVIYLDTREDLGVFSEYVYLSGSASDYYSEVPGDRVRRA